MGCRRRRSSSRMSFERPEEYALLALAHPLGGQVVNVIRTLRNPKKQERPERGPP